MAKKFKKVWIEIVVEHPDCSFKIFSKTFERDSKEYERFEVECRENCRFLRIPVREELLPDIFADECRDSLIREKLGQEYRYVAEEFSKDRIVNPRGELYGFAMWHKKFLD